MKPSILIGVVIALVLIAAAIAAPMFISGDEATALRAREEAELANRQLARVDLRLLQLAPMAQVNDEALAAAAERATEDIRAIASRYGKVLQDIGAEGVQPLPAGVAGAREALKGLREALKEHEALLQEAIRTAQSAVSTDRNALGPAQVLGTAKYVLAVGQFSASSQTRAAQYVAESRLFDLAADLQRAESLVDHYRGLNVGPVIAQLQQELTELAQQRDAAQVRVQQLTQQVDERTQRLASAEQELQVAQQKYQEVEQRGFTPGDDASFKQYSTDLAAAAQQQRDLDVQAQRLRFGGLNDAKFAGDDYATAPVEGGEPVVGLAELQEWLATAQQVAERYGNSHVALEQRIEQLRKMDARAQEEITHYQSQVVDFKKQQQAAVQQVGEIAATALKQEGEALQTARDAANAFKTSQSAYDAWVSAVRTLQGEKDPERANPRLNVILGNEYYKQVGAGGEAAARMLVARVYAQRADANQRLLDDMRTFLDMNTDAELKFDSTAYQTAVDESRAAGLEAADAATRIYEQLSRSPAATAWVPLGALAAAHHLAARLDPANEGEQMSAAYEALRKAVEGHENFPYAEKYVQFYQHMGGARRTGGTDEPAGDESFFMDGQ